jgi:hypothetical protein
VTRDYSTDQTGLRMWFRDEIRNALLSVYASGSARSACDMGPESEAFQRGFTAALIAVGLNFGIGRLPFPDADRTPAVQDQALRSAHPADSGDRS